jgi:hypothetical protein
MTNTMWTPMHHMAVDKVGALVHWCIGALVRWCVGALVHWCIGALVHWCCHDDHWCQCLRIDSLAH